MALPAVGETGTIAAVALLAEKAGVAAADADADADVIVLARRMGRRRQLFRRVRGRVVIVAERGEGRG